MALDFYTYDQTFWDADSSSIDFTLKNKNINTGQVINYEATYADYLQRYQTTLHFINDNITSTYAKEEIKLFPYSTSAILTNEERTRRRTSPSTFVFYGITNGSPAREFIPLLELNHSPINKSIYGITYISVNDKYFNGETVSQALEDDVDADTIRQVFKCEYRDRSGRRRIEFAGTPRQIAHYLVGGLPFASEKFYYPLDIDTVENEKDVYADERSKPGDTFNSFWQDHYDSIIQIEEFETQFVDAKNAPFYAIVKSAIATLTVSMYRAVKLFNKFFVNKFDQADVDYWNEVLDTKIYSNSYYSDKTQTITAVSTDLFNRIKSITIDSATGWPPFAFVWRGNELLQYRRREGNTLYDIVRHIRGRKNASIIAGDSLRLLGTVRIEETEPLYKDRMAALLGPKETVENMQTAVNSVIGNSPLASATVFDCHGFDYNDSTKDLYNWVWPKRDIGWFLGKKGYYSLRGRGNYTAATALITLTDIDSNYVIENVSTGDTLYFSYDGENYSSATVYSVDIDNETIKLIDYLRDSEGTLLDNKTNKKLDVYAVGTETRKIKNRNTDNKFNFSVQTWLGKKTETTGYFYNTFDISTILYETSANSSATTLASAVSADDTSEYRLPSNKLRYNYTGRVKSYELNESYTNKVEGKYPFFVVVDKWQFNDHIITDIVDRAKCIGTTPNYAINKTFVSYRTSIANENAPFFDFILANRNE